MTSLHFKHAFKMDSSWKQQHSSSYHAWKAKYEHITQITSMLYICLVYVGELQILVVDKHYKPQLSNTCKAYVSNSHLFAVKYFDLYKHQPKPVSHPVLVYIYNNQCALFSKSSPFRRQKVWVQMILQKQDYFYMRTSFLSRKSALTRILFLQMPIGTWIWQFNNLHYSFRALLLQDSPFYITHCRPPSFCTH